MLGRYMTLIANLIAFSTFVASGYAFGPWCNALKLDFTNESGAITSIFLMFSVTGSAYVLFYRLSENKWPRF
jgi:hypothetical protein